MKKNCIMPISNGCQDFSSVTEVTGNNITYDQLKRMYTRYAFASQKAQEKDILEVACGSGQGLGLLASRARRVVGLDIDPKLCALARAHYAGRGNIEIHHGDGQEIPFDGSSFDLLLLFEAIYYLQDPNAFLREARRVLKPDGQILICSANPEWKEFNPSPFSIRYFSARELGELLKGYFSEVRLFGYSSTKPSSVFGLIASLLKKTAVRLRLMPETMKGKEFLKRLFVGKLSPLPPEILSDSYPIEELTSISLSDSPVSSWKVIMAQGFQS